MQDPKHDAESMALEEQMGLGAIELDFGTEGRVIVPLPDNRQFRRAMKEGQARLDAAVRRTRRRPYGNSSSL